MRLIPRQPVPALEFGTLGGGGWSLAAQKPQNFTMVVFYRGLHRPICRKYTSELNGMIGEFDRRGVSTVVTSNDTRERAQEAKERIGKSIRGQRRNVPRHAWQSIRLARLGQ